MVCMEAAHTGYKHSTYKALKIVSFHALEPI